MMTNPILGRFRSLCCLYGHKSKSVFKIEFGYIDELEHEIESALKLQKLIKKRIKIMEKQREDNEYTSGLWHSAQSLISELESLMKKSNK